MQHINLFSQLERAVEPVFSARRQMIAVGLIAVLMIGLFSLTLVEEKNLAIKLSNLERQEKEISSELLKLQVRKKRLQDDPLLDQKIKSLTRNIKFRRKIITSLGSGEESFGKGFSHQLSGLARQHIEGMWFTTIELNEGGQQMALSGRSRRPEFIPRYLQKLSNEIVFSGQQFKVLRMSLPEEELGVMDFEIRAAEVVVSQ